jgi:hypothetical protein
MVPDHGDATAGWGDDVIVGAEELQKAFGEWACLFGAAGVGHRLAAASLACGEFNVVAGFFQKLNGGHADARVELVDIARDEKTDRGHEGLGGLGAGKTFSIGRGRFADSGWLVVRRGGNGFWRRFLCGVPGGSRGKCWWGNDFGRSGGVKGGGVYVHLGHIYVDLGRIYVQFKSHLGPIYVQFKSI